MRIQHNIMAMNAYRNYTNNVSAMKSNLEKLSSGYKINRAGDDAAGLAISEKMRAQITGLKTAQKNAKDGISLVQTAEGALTEVHDMLNRMVELATQSANGTYDNDTDREQLQKEMNQLREEINRIADSSNFNGIKLLDGTMDAGGGSKQVSITLPKDSATQFGEIGDKTILKGAGKAAQSTVFGVQFDNLAIDAKAGDTLKVAIGTDEVTITLKEQKYTAEDLATELQKAFTDNGGTIGGQAFTAAVGEDDTSVIFTQTTPPTGTTDTVEASMDVKMTYTGNGGAGTAQVLSDGIQVFDETAKKPAVTATPGADGKEAVEGKTAKGSIDLSSVISAFDNAVDSNTTGGSVEIGGVTYNWGSDATEGATKITVDDATTIKAAFKTELKNAIPSGWSGDWNSETATTLDVTASAKGDKSEAKPSVAGVEATLTENGSADQAEVQATPANVDVDFAGLTGSDVLGDKVTIGDKTYEFVADAGDVSDGNVAVVVTESADAAALTSAFNTAVEGSTPSGTTVTTTGTTVVVTTTATGASATLTASSVDAAGGDEGDEGDKTTAVNDTLFAASEGIDVSGGNLDKKLTDIDIADGQGGTVKADTIFTGLSDRTAGDSGEIDIKLSEITFAADDTLKSALKKISDAYDTAITEWNNANSATKGYHYEYNGLSTDGKESGKISLQVATDITALINKVQGQAEPPAASTGSGVSGSYNAATVKITQGNAVVADQRASTWINLGDVFGGDIGDGSTLTIGENTYTFKWGDSNSFSGTTITLDKNASAADRINYAAKAMSNMSNSAFSIGNETTGGKITIDEKAGNEKYKTELSTHKGFESLFSAKSVTASDSTKGLRLQIGDTADDYNQLRVSIGDTHCDSLGIADISIADQDSAAAAIDKIKAAINQVSDIRGTLGATQNRLDHTINNLSVMQENIQDAESTIRDVDVAEEMMAYTKNNILIQSAQAMLAQANQVPQGVLQLLQ